MLNGCYKDDTVIRYACIYKECYFYSNGLAFVLKIVFLMFIQHLMKRYYFELMMFE